MRASLACALFVMACDAPQVAFNDAGFAVFDAADATLVATGNACGTNDQGEPIGGCSAGQFCISPDEGFPNGYCAPDCRAAPCAEGDVCFPSSAQHHYCLRGCERDGDCRQREGYVCRAWRPGARPACVPNEEPIGRRDDGRACFATEGDGSVGPFLAPLPTGRFARAASLTRGRFEAMGEAEVSLAVDATGNAVVAFMGVDNRGLYWRGGVARVAPDGAVGAVTVLHDFDYPDTLAPGVAFDRAGRLHLVYVANHEDRPGNFLRHAVSLDGGVTFDRARSAFADVVCGLNCSSPMIAAGPDGDGDAVYVAAIAGQRDGTGALQVARMAADGSAFDPHSTLARLEVTSNARRAPGIASLAAGPARGAVYAAWVDRNVSHALSALGDRVNRVRLRASTDGARTWGDVEEVSRPEDAPVGHVPWVGAGGGVLHVAYVTGGLTGAWDVVLATRRDGDTQWQHRVVNDDPARCATHAFAGLSVDAVTGAGSVLWLDNRYGAGVVAFARCAADATVRCTRNEAVSDEGFVFTTARDPLRWHGTRSALARGPDGTLWGAWSDTRTGGPGVYAARALMR